jgi:hypothetical protein
MCLPGPTYLVDAHAATTAQINAAAVVTLDAAAIKLPGLAFRAGDTPCGRSLRSGSDRATVDVTTKRSIQTSGPTRAVQARVS